MNKHFSRGICAAGGLLLAALVTACSDPGAIGNDLPINTDKVGVTYVDTFTVRTSTVLIDSVVTSPNVTASTTATPLLVGRYVDPRLGTVEARSYAQVGLGTPFTPSPTASLDSIVLTLRTDTYRYGDTTRTQRLLVQRLQEDFTDRAYYSSEALRYDATPLGQVGSTKAKEYTFRARPGARTLRIRLTDDLGRELLQLAQSGSLASDTDLQSRFKGLVLSPGAADNAALLRFNGVVTGTALNLYYHEAASASDVIVHSFPLLVGNRQFYSLRADRRATLLAPLTRQNQALSSTATAGETYIEAGLGLYTRIDIPYITDLRELGGTFAIISAELTMETVQGSESPYLAPPAKLTVSVTDPTNRRGYLLLGIDGNPENPISGTYARSISTRTGLEQGSYKFQLTTYLQAVLNRTLPNTGLLLNTSDTDVVERAVLGASRNSSNPLQFKVYYARVQ